MMNYCMYVGGPIVLNHGLSQNPSFHQVASGCKEDKDNEM